MMVNFAGAHAWRAILCFCLLTATAGCGKVAVSENDTPGAGVEDPNGGAEPAPGIAPDSVTLSWIPPQANTDGSYLDDLAGYKIYSGPTQDNLAPRETIDNPGLSSVVVEPLDSDEVFFAITALNSEGVESALSEVVQAPSDG
jgi:hypothetical protein